MSAPHRTETKALSVDGLETKALSVDGLEDKTAKPNKAATEQEQPKQEQRAGQVQITLAVHHRYKGEHYLPGETINVDPQLAHHLTVAGIARAND